MNKCNTLNVKFSNSQLNKLESGINNGTEVSLKISLTVVADSNGENNFPHKFSHKFWGFVKVLQIIPQLIWNYQKLNCVK